MNHQLSPGKYASGLLGKTNRLFSMLAVIALLVSSFTSSAQSPEVKKALRLIDIEQPTKAIKALEELAASGDNSAMQYYLGLGYLRTGNKDKALAAFEKGITINEKDGLNFAGKAQVKLTDKNTTEAKMLLDKALALSRSKDVNVLKALGEAYLTDTKYLLDAIKVLEKAKAINSADPEVHLLLGDALILQNPGAGGESVSSYERAARADAKSGKPHHKVARIYQRSKNTDLVLESLKQTVSIDPEYAPAWKDLGELYYKGKEAIKAVEAYEKYMAISEKADDVKFQYAFFLIMAKQFDRANAIFKEVLSKPNPPAIALKYAAYAWLEKDTTRASAEQAKPLLEQYFQKAKPEEIQASDYAYYGRMLLEIKQDSLANENFAKSLDMDSAQQEILQLHADTYLKRKKLPEAIEAYKQLMSIRKQPLSQDLWSIGRAYYFNGQFAEADSAFTKLSERQPTVIIGYVWAAKARIQLDPEGKQLLAKPMYEKVVEIGSASPEKYKKELIEAYDYLGTSALQHDNDVLKAKSYFEKVLALDPTNARANEFMAELKKPVPNKGR